MQYDTIRCWWYITAGLAETRTTTIDHIKGTVPRRFSQTTFFLLALWESGARKNETC